MNTSDVVNLYRTGSIRIYIGKYEIQRTRNRKDTKKVVNESVLPMNNKVKGTEIEYVRSWINFFIVSTFLYKSHV